MSRWLPDLLDHVEAGTPAVLVTIAGARGSTPREAGTKMIVTADGQSGTIGGGNLEFRAAELAHEMLAGGPPAAVHEFPLGPSLGQCCGGHTVLGFRRIAASDRDWVAAVDRACRAGTPVVTVGRADGDGVIAMVGDDRLGSLGDSDLDRHATDRARLLGATTLFDETGPAPLLYDSWVDDADHLYLFGAGHVGRAIVHAMAPLPALRLAWIDSRTDLFPAAAPRNVEIVVSDDPAAEVAAMPPGAYVLVMTHSHAIDYDIVEAVLRRGDTRYCGLIGSSTKRSRFEKRWRHRGLPETALGHLTSPIGTGLVGGKDPAVIALAVAVEIQALRETAASGDSDEVLRA